MLASLLVMANPRAPGADPSEVLELIDLGWKHRAIATHLGVTRGVVHGIARTARGVRRTGRPRGRPQGSVELFPHALRDQLLRLWDAGWGVKRLGFELRVPDGSRVARAAVRRELRALGVSSGVGYRTPAEREASRLRTTMRYAPARPRGPLLPWDWDGQAPFAVYPDPDPARHFPAVPTTQAQEGEA